MLLVCCLLFVFIVVVDDVDNVASFVHVQSNRIDMNVKKKGKQAKNKQGSSKQQQSFLLPLKKKKIQANEKQLFTYHPHVP